MPIQNQIHEVEDNLLAAIDYCYEQGWTDGLPVVPPEESRVTAMCAMEGCLAASTKMTSLKKSPNSMGWMNRKPTTTEGMANSTRGTVTTHGDS